MSNAPFPAAAVARRAFGELKNGSDLPRLAPKTPLRPSTSQPHSAPFRPPSSKKRCNRALDPIRGPQAKRKCEGEGGASGTSRAEAMAALLAGFDEDSDEDEDEAMDDPTDSKAGGQRRRRYGRSLAKAASLAEEYYEGRPLFAVTGRKWRCTIDGCSHEGSHPDDSPVPRGFKVHFDTQHLDQLARKASVPPICSTIPSASFFAPCTAATSPSTQHSSSASSPSLPSAPPSSSSRPPLPPCKGVLLPLPLNVSHRLHYPLHLLDETSDGPFRLLSVDGGGRIEERVKHNACLGSAPTEGEGCYRCRLALLDAEVASLARRVETPRKTGPLHRRTPSELLHDAVAQKKLRSAERVKQYRYNRKLSRALLRRANAEALARAVAACGANIRTSQIVRRGLEEGRSIGKIAELLLRAKAEGRRTQDWLPIELAAAKVAKLVGHARGSHVVAAAFGGPGERTVQRQLHQHRYRPSHGSSLREDVGYNLSRSGFLPRSDPSLPLPPITKHASLLVDEIAVESRLVLDSTFSRVYGICHEHGQRVDNAFDAWSDVGRLGSAMKREGEGKEERASSAPEGCAHRAREATVVAVRVHDGEESHARLVAVVGSCKKDRSADVEASLLAEIEEVVRARLREQGIRLVAVATDGDAVRRSALDRTFRALIADIPLLSELVDLPGFARVARPDGEGIEYDIKHLIKRIRTALARLLGLSVGSFLLKSEHILLVLRAAYPPERWKHLERLLYPGDAQNVPAAFALLLAIAEALERLRSGAGASSSSFGSTSPAATATAGAFPTSSATSSPSSTPSVSASSSPSPSPPPDPEVLRALTFLNLIFSHLTRAFTTADISLPNFLSHLSQTSALLLLYRRLNGKDGLPVEIYHNLQTTIVSVFMQVAVMKQDSPDSSFFPCLIGTDQLEQLFGIIRTLIPGNRHVDLVTLCEHAGNAQTLDEIYRQFPSLKPKREDRRDLRTPDGFDHARPSSFTGSLAVRDVDLRKVWSEGFEAALREAAGLSVVFAAAADSMRNAVAAGNCDVLRPLGEYLLRAPGTEEETEEEMQEGAQEAVQGSVTATEQEERDLGVEEGNIEISFDLDNRESGRENLDDVDLSSLFVAATTSSSSKDTSEDDDLAAAAQYGESGMGSEMREGEIPPVPADVAPPLPSTPPPRNMMRLPCGRLALKSRLLSQLDWYDRDPGKSNDRNRRCMAVSRSLQASARALSLGKVLPPDAEAFTFGSLVGVRLRVDGAVRLFVGEIVSLKHHGQPYLALDRTDLSDPNTTVSLRPLILFRTSTSSIVVSSARPFLNSQRPFEIPAIPGASVVPLTSTVTTCSSSDEALHRLDADVLEELVSNTETHRVFALPSKINPSHAYGDAHLGYLPTDVPFDGSASPSSFRCPSCPLSFPRTKLLHHLSAHILRKELDPSHCGWCGSDDRSHFPTYHTKGGRPTGTLSSPCPLAFKSLKILLSSKPNSPSTNAPILCWRCATDRPLAERQVWRYGLLQHFQQHHPDVAQPLKASGICAGLSIDVAVSEAERAVVEAQDRGRVRGKGRPKKSAERRAGGVDQE